MIEDIPKYNRLFLLVEKQEMNQKKIATEIILEFLQKKIFYIFKKIIRKYEIIYSLIRGFLYKIAPPELKISPIMYFVMYNSIIQDKVPKITVTLKQKFEKLIFTI